MGETLGTASLELRTTDQGLTVGIRKAKGAADSLRSSFSKVSAAIITINQGFQLARSAARALGTAFEIAIGPAADFEQSMNTVRALTQSTGDAFDSLSDKARELGETTKFTAVEAADGMAFLAQAGFETTEILSAMPDILNLAAAANLDLASSADIASNIMQGYGIDAAETGRVTDVLTKAFISSNTNLTQLGEAMKLAGPVAEGFGIQFEEAVAAVGLMGNAGFQASLAGTALRGALIRLANPTEKVTETIESLGVAFKDSKGEIVSIEEIIRLLKTSGASTAQIMEIFGQRAGPAMQALVKQGSDALREFKESLEAAGGTAEEVAKVKMEGFRSAVVEMQSAWAGFIMSVNDSFETLAFLEEFVDNITRNLRFFTIEADDAEKAFKLLNTAITDLSHEELVELRDNLIASGISGLLVTEKIRDLNEALIKLDIVASTANESVINQKVIMGLLVPPLAAGKKNMQAIAEANREAQVAIDGVTKAVFTMGDSWVSAKTILTVVTNRSKKLREEMQALLDLNRRLGVVIVELNLHTVGFGDTSGYAAAKMPVWNNEIKALRESAEELAETMETAGNIFGDKFLKDSDLQRIEPVGAEIFDLNEKMFTFGDTSEFAAAQMHVWNNEMDALAERAERAKQSIEDLTVAVNLAAQQPGNFFGTIPGAPRDEGAGGGFDFGALTEGQDFAGLGSRLGRQAASQVAGLSGAISGGIQAGPLGAAAGFFTELILSNEDIQEVMGELSAVMMELIAPIAEALAPALKELVPILIELKPVFELIGDVLGVLIPPLIVAMQALGWVLGTLNDSVSFVSEFFLDFGRQFEAFLKTLPLVIAVLDALDGAFTTLSDGVSVLSEFIEKLEETLDLVMSPIPSAMDALSGGLTTLNDTFDYLARQLRKLRRALGGGGIFAEGGRPPVNRLSVIGEEGPELFLPDVSGTVIPNNMISDALDRLGSGGPAREINITLPGSDTISYRKKDIRRLIGEINNALADDAASLTLQVTQ